jgi:hypothetical protein
MNFSMVRPCEKCPFRKDIPAYLRKDRVIEIVSALKVDGTFPCHETVTHDDDGEHLSTPEEQFCAGAMVMLEKSEDAEQAPLNQMLRIAERLGFYDHKKLDMKSSVFDCFSDMIEAQDR